MRRGVVLLFVVAVMSVVPAVPAADGGDAVEQCYSSAGGFPVAGTRACRTGQAFINGFGRLCRFAGGAETCTNVDGRSISPQLVDSFEGSWVPRALALQRALDDDLPLRNELWLHTHNSYNAEAYQATFSGLDPNQIYSLTDQLRMGVRAIELDVHWAPYIAPTEEIKDGGRAPIVCHGEPVNFGVDSVHFGCTSEVHLRTRLAEVRQWLIANENEVLMIYLENALDNNPLAHQRAVEAIEEILGGYIYGPATGGGCQSLPINLSRSQIRAVGRVILTGNCGPDGSSWNDTVFQRGPSWIESGFRASEYDCEVERAQKNYDNNWIRYYEDSTWLSAMVDGSGLGGTARIPAGTASQMVRCGVNMVGFDQLQPFDPKIEALVWSWKTNEPPFNSNGLCAFEDAGGRFDSDACDSSIPRKFACMSSTGWVISNGAGSWSEGEAACEAQTAIFAVPRNGYENELLKAASNSQEVWLAYHFDSSTGTWIHGI